MSMLAFATERCSENHSGAFVNFELKRHVFFFTSWSNRFMLEFNRWANAHITVF